MVVVGVVVVVVVVVVAVFYSMNLYFRSFTWDSEMEI